jgi:hypothetical protein
MDSASQTSVCDASQSSRGQDGANTFWFATTFAKQAAETPVTTADDGRSEAADGRSGRRYRDRQDPVATGDGQPR